MYCRNCGKEIDDSYKCCPFCGSSIGEVKQETSTVQTNNQNAVIDSGHIGWAFLGFFIPLVGLILFLVWHDNKPKTAKQCGKGALISVIVEVCVGILIFIVMMILIFAIPNYIPEGGSDVIVTIINNVL